MKSVALLLYKPTESSFDEIARDFSPYWTSAVEIIDDDTFLAAENNFNIFTCQKDSAATTEEERRRLSVVGRFHVNDFINVFHHGSLVMNNPNESQGSFQPSILFGTTSGSIGLIIQLPSHMFSFLQQLEQKLVSKLRSVGNISHAAWRSFVYDFSSEPSVGFVDGDLIEQFLDMPVSDRETLVKGLQMEDKSGTKKIIAVDDVVKLVEELARLH